MLVATDGEDEATLRTAINRIYYGAHLRTGEKAEAKKLWTPTGNPQDHGNLVRSFEPTGGAGIYPTG